MNIIKIQQDIIKDILNDKRGNWFIQIKDSEVFIITRYQIYILDPKKYVLDVDKLGLSNTNIADSLVNKADDAKSAVQTGLLKIIDKKTCIELKCEDNNELIYLDQSLLKYYDKSAKFEAVDHKSPVYVYEDDILVGCVLPVRVV